MSKKPYKPQRLDIRNVAAWLRSTSEGSTILREACREWLEQTEDGESIVCTACREYLESTPDGMKMVREATQRERSEPVLIVIGGGCEGQKEWIEVYGNNIRVKIVHLLLTPCEALAEEYMECKLPHWCREIYDPQHRKSTETLPQRVTAEERLEALEYVQVLRAIKQEKAAKETR